MNNNNLEIFVHVPKTGGTAYVKLKTKNLRKDEYLILDYKKLKINPDSGEKINFKKIVFAYLASIPLKKREKIRFLAGHVMPFGVHRFFPQKARYFTFLREPIARTQSLYNYFQTLYERENFFGKKKRLYRNILLVKGKVPSFSKWLLYKFGDRTRVFSLGTITDFFQKLGYFEQRIKLNKFSYIADIKKAARDFNLPKENVSFHYAEKLDKDDEKILKEKLKDDIKLYGLL